MDKKKRQKCTVYSRIVGYLTPVETWNVGKKAEWKERKVFKLNPSKGGEEIWKKNIVDLKK